MGGVGHGVGSSSGADADDVPVAKKQRATTGARASDPESFEWGNGMFYFMHMPATSTGNPSFRAICRHPNHKGGVGGH